MGERVIYFEKASEATKAFINQYRNLEDQVFYWQELSEREQKECLGIATCLVIATFKITAELINGAPNLKLIQRAGIGLDNVDLKAAKERGIQVANTPGVNAVSVAELTIGFILSLYRKISFMNEATQEGKWLMWEYRPFMHEMNGKVHGILGMGNVGREVAKRSKAFNTQVLYYDAYRLSVEQEKELGIEFSTLERILTESDILSVHIPLLEETRNLIGENELSKMKKDAILINVARGNIVDEEAVAKALQEGTLAGAAFDTFAVEPFELSSPLANCPNVILTPHIAGGTLDVLKEGIKRSFENIRRIEKGEILVGGVK